MSLNLAFRRDPTNRFIKVVGSGELLAMLNIICLGIPMDFTHGHNLIGEVGKIKYY